MPTYVQTDDCDGCEGRTRMACRYICPLDLMHLDPDGADTGHAMKAFCVEPEQCSECYACVKICPRQAIAVRHYADVVPMGATVQPTPPSDAPQPDAPQPDATEPDAITPPAIDWTITSRDGSSMHLRFPTRTTPTGSIDPYRDKARADIAKLGEPGFFNLGNVATPGDPEELIRR